VSPQTAVLIRLKAEQMRQALMENDIVGARMFLRDIRSIVDNVERKIKEGK
jgi:hypothetical protein